MCTRIIGLLNFAGTQKGISQLQGQLDSREQELALERGLRKQLERQIDSSRLNKMLVDEVTANKHYAYF